MSSPDILPTAFFLHGLGGSKRWWEPMIDALDGQFRTVPIDLPGFGGEADSMGVTVAEMVDHVVSAIRRVGAARWILVGHSMGGKLASIVAARTMAGEEGLYGLAGVVLLAGSPPTPEPMEEERRADMLQWAAQGHLDAAAARDFVDANVGSPLDPSADRMALEALQSASPVAWRAWLDRGSREDWSGDVGTLDVPSLILVGSEDGPLGEAGQRATNAKVYPRARIVSLEGAGHLLMLERPQQVAQALIDFWQGNAGRGPAVTPAFASLIASARVSRRMRAALTARSLADEPQYAPQSLSPEQLDTLRAMATMVVPQGEKQMPIDLAARLDANLSRGLGDGWRFADLPDDAEAYRRALNALHGLGSSTHEERQATLRQVAEGRFSAGADPSSVGEAGLNSAQMKRWFEDACADLARLWLAHPATMERIGFDGFANGGDAPRKQGFEQLSVSTREAWEPLEELHA